MDSTLTEVGRVNLVNSTPEFVNEAANVRRWLIINYTQRGAEVSRKKSNQENPTLGLEAEEAGEKAEKEIRDSAGKKRKVGTKDEIQTGAEAYEFGGMSLVLLQVNCRIIYNKALEFWHLVDTYNPDIIIGTESWLREEFDNTEIFRADFTTFRRDRPARGGEVFICVKNNVTCSELWVDDDFEIIAVEVKGSDTNDTCEIVGIYRAPNEDIRVIEKLADRTGF
jgi:hypothetical protein